MESCGQKRSESLKVWCGIAPPGQAPVVLLSSVQIYWEKDSIRMPKFGSKSAALERRKICEASNFRRFSRNVKLRSRLEAAKDFHFVSKLPKTSEL